MFEIDWSNLQVYHYLAIGGGGLAVLALVLYFVLPSGFKIPAGILGTVAGLVTGLGAGVLGMAALGYHTTPHDEVANAERPPGAGGMPGAMAMPPGGKGMPGIGGIGMPPMGGGKGKKGPSPKNQLATLVVKLQQLTDKPLTLSLSDAQRTTIREQLKDLADQDELNDDDAKSRLDAILKSVESERKILEAAGYNWPGGGGGGIPTPPATMSNPFKEGPNHDRLTGLQENLAKKK